MLTTATTAVCNPSPIKLKRIAAVRSTLLLDSVTPTKRSNNPRSHAHLATACSALALGVERFCPRSKNALHSLKSSRASGETLRASNLRLHETRSWQPATQRLLDFSSPSQRHHNSSNMLRTGKGLTTRVSDSRWQRARDCNHSGLQPITVETETHSGCSLHPIVRPRNHINILPTVQTSRTSRRMQRQAESADKKMQAAVSANHRSAIKLQQQLRKSRA